MKTKLIVFIKNPEAGHVKTRIAKTVGDKEALNIYIKLINHTLDVVKASGLKTEIHFSKSVESNDIDSFTGFALKTQIGLDLGERMHNAFQSAFENGYRKVIIIGSDCLQLRPEHLIEASEILNDNDVVLGPADDGGYYLIGMTDSNPDLLLNKDWSHASVFSDAITTLESQQKSIHLLEALSDIDTFQDWEKYKHILGE